MAPTTACTARLFLGTADGLRIARLVDGEVVIEAGGIRDNAVRDIAVHPGDPNEVLVGCGLRGWGLHHTADGGETFRELGFEDRWVWGVTRHPLDPDTVFVGTEPPMLYRSTDHGSTFEAYDEIDDLPSRDRWTFFHEPFRAGHIHGIAIHPDRPDRIYAGVEHGALIYSHDAGETWQETLVGADLHRVAVDPADSDHVLAGTGSGLSQSWNAGAEWEETSDLAGRYVHSIEFDPEDADHVVVYVQQDDNPLYHSEDRGETWTPIGNGLPAARPADNVRFLPGGQGSLIYAGDDGDRGQLYLSTDRGERWTQVGDALPKVWRVAVAPVAD